jgi:hypothetical protein
MDPYFPASSGSSINDASYFESYDSCLGNTNTDGFYHYHMAPVCVASPSYATTPSDCVGNDACATNLITYAESAFSSY